MLRWVPIVGKLTRLYNASLIGQQLRGSRMSG